MSIVLLLSIMCVSEVGFTDNVDECRLMWHINLDRASMSGRSLASQVKRYNSAFKVPSATRPYLLHLKLDGSQPLHWPQSKLRWSRYQRRWKAIVKAAESFYVNPGEHPCPEANQYGGPVDGKHADDVVPACWVRKGCPGNGKLAQAYYQERKCTLPARVAKGE